MCNPVAIGIAMGGLTAVSGIQEQNAAYKNQVAGVNRSNAIAIQKYEYDLKIAQREDQIAGREFEAALQAAAAEKASYYKQLEINQVAANNASVAEQLKLEEAINKAEFDSQANLAKSIQAQGTMLASGLQPGQSMLLELNNVERQIGFEQAQIDASLDSATRAYGIAQFGIDLDKYSADTRAFNQLDGGPSFAPDASFAPISPIMAQKPSKPSILGPLLRGASAGMGSYTQAGGEWF